MASKNSTKSKENIREFVWHIINTDMSIKRDLARDILNTRSLAKYIIKTHKLESSLDAVISAIRRFNVELIAKEDNKSAYNILKQARMNIKNKMSSILVKRTDGVKTILGRPDRIFDYQGHEIVRIIEGKEVLTLIFDRRNYEKVLSLFPKKVIIKTNKKVGMIELNYPLALERTPGVFSIISGEFAQNNISIIDAVISSSEHIIVIEEEHMLKAIELMYKLCE